MSETTCPNCAWAIKAARALKLPPAARLILIAVAERVSRFNLEWKGSIGAICDDTGLSARTIRYVLSNGERGCADLKRALQVASDARGTRLIFRLNRVSLDELEPTPAMVAGSDEPQRPAKIARTPAKTAPKPPETPAMVAGNPLREESPSVPPKSARGRAHARGEQELPKDWRPSERSLSLADTLGFDADRIELEADKMRAWASMKRKRGRDWDMRFDNWLREAATRQMPNRRSRDPIEEFRREHNLPSFLDGSIEREAAAA